mmetsp:Transcript_3422/g.4934  ORF Transcript_3422/g.4934 Transcript_3422/m.4934 type:complete len:220 (-) Transcript_3422:100-759(-)
MMRVSSTDTTQFTAIAVCVGARAAMESHSPQRQQSTAPDWKDTISWLPCSTKESARGSPKGSSPSSSGTASLARRLPVLASSTLTLPPALATTNSSKSASYNKAVMASPDVSGADASDFSGACAEPTLSGAMTRSSSFTCQRTVHSHDNDDAACDAGDALPPPTRCDLLKSYMRNTPSSSPTTTASVTERPSRRVLSLSPPARPSLLLVWIGVRGSPSG